MAPAILSVSHFGQVFVIAVAERHSTHSQPPNEATCDTNVHRSITEKKQNTTKWNF